METSTEPVSVRLARLNKEIVSKPKRPNKPQLLNRECILDALQVLYESCSVESLQKRDQNIADFAKKYKQAINDINALRVNISDFEIKNVIGNSVLKALFQNIIWVVFRLWTFWTSPCSERKANR